MSELVIFDCDGVLVDSEVIFARILGECLSAADFPATVAEALVLGFGHNRDTLSAAVAARFGPGIARWLFRGDARADRCRPRTRARAGARDRGIADRTADGALRRLERSSRPGARAAGIDGLAALFRSACLQRHPGRPRQARARSLSDGRGALRGAARPVHRRRGQRDRGRRRRSPPACRSSGSAAAATARATTPSSCLPPVLAGLRPDERAGGPFLRGRMRIIQITDTHLSRASAFRRQLAAARAMDRRRTPRSRHSHRRRHRRRRRGR